MSKNKKNKTTKLPSKTQKAKAEKKVNKFPALDFIRIRTEKEKKLEQKEVVAAMSFKEKLSAISQAVKILPVTGVAKDGSFWYDQAAEIFPKFNDLFAKYHILPPNMKSSTKEIKMVGITPVLFYQAMYELRDIDSEEREFIVGESESNNWPFAVDSARTWAMKRALKDRFLSGCPQPENDENTPHVDNKFGAFIEEYQHKTAEARLKEREEEQNVGKEASKEITEFFGEPAKTAKDEPKPIQFKNPEPLPGMSTPGPKQYGRIKDVEEHYRKVCKVTSPEIQFHSQAVRNSLWAFFGMRWPKSNAEVKEFTDKAEYACMFTE